MRVPLRVLAVLNACLFFAAFGCGDEGGGCGPEPQQNEEAAPAAGVSGNTGSTNRAGNIEIQDKKGRVPKAYQRPGQYDDEKSSATISKPVIVKSTAAAPAAAPPSRVMRVTRRKVDGIIDRVEVNCRIIAVSPDGRCAGASNYDEIKRRCCPGGLVERCRTTTGGVILVGRGCEPAK